MPKQNLKRAPAGQSRRIKSKTSSGINPETLPPVFSLEHMVDGYCVNSCQKDEKAMFADALYKRSKLTWSELRQPHGLGFEKIKFLKKNSRQR